MPTFQLRDTLDLNLFGCLINVLLGVDFTFMPEHVEVERRLVAVALVAEGALVLFLVAVRGLVSLE